jgi:hypothetical protein
MPPLIFFLAPLNPWLIAVLQKAMASSVYWRVTWCLLIPAYGAFGVMALLRLGAQLPALSFPRVSRKVSVGQLAVWAMMAWLLVPNFLLRPSNAGFGWPSLKFPIPDYQAAREIADMAQGHGTVLATQRVAAARTSIPGHPRLHILRPDYLIALTRGRASQSDIGDMSHLFALLSGGPITAGDDLRLDKALRADDQLYIIADPAAHPSLKAYLEAKGFGFSHLGSGHLLWMRRPSR